MQTSHAIASALNVVRTSHSYGDIMLLEKALQSKRVCISQLIFISCSHFVSFFGNFHTKDPSPIMHPFTT